MTQKQVLLNLHFFEPEICYTVLSENHIKSFSPISSKIETTSGILSLTTKCVLPSAEPVNWASWKNRNMSHKKLLNKIGLKIEPCGTPEMIFFRELNLELTFVLCQRFEILEGALKTTNQLTEAIESF